MRKLYEQDIIEILYGATLLGAGGGGSLSQGLGMLEGLKEDGHKIELELLELDDIYIVQHFILAHSPYLFRMEQCRQRGF